MSHVWPTSTEAMNTAWAIGLVGGTALALLIVTYWLDWLQDRWQQKADRAKAKVIEEVHSDMAQRRAQATRGRGR